MNPTDIKTLSTADLVALYNRLAGKNIKKFESRAIAEARVEIALSNGSPAAVAVALTAKNKPMGDARQSGPKRTGLPGPNSQYAGKRLHIVTKTNPRRAGTAGWNSFEVMREGMTYEEYRLKGGRSNDLAWDVAHGYVEMR